MAHPSFCDEVDTSTKPMLELSPLPTLGSYSERYCLNPNSAGAVGSMAASLTDGNLASAQIIPTKRSLYIPKENRAMEETE